MSKYKVLWIDDKWEQIESFKEVLEINGFDVITSTNAVEGMEIFESHLEEWSGVILDAKVLYSPDSQVDTLKGLRYSLDKINELKSKRFVPHYILTGQPDLSSASTFAEMHEGIYYEKDKDEEKLIEDLKRNADSLHETQIIHKYQTVFDTWPESQHDLLRILTVLENEDWQNNSVLNDIRKIMTDVMERCYERGFCLVKNNGSNLAECSRMLGNKYMEPLIPVYVQRSMHSCVEITNPGSHRTETDDSVKSGRAPYLIRSLIYDMLNILYWCRILPPKDENEKTRRVIEQLKNDFEKQKEIEKQRKIR